MPGFEDYTPTREDLNSILDPDELARLRDAIGSGYGDGSIVGQTPEIPFADQGDKVEGAL